MMIIRRYFLLLIVLTFAAVVSAATDVDSLVATFQQVRIPRLRASVGPLPSPKTDALPTLQVLIDGLARNGGGRLIVKPGTYMLRGSLVMKSGVELHLEEGALLLFSGEADDFLPVVKTRWEGTDLMGRSAMIYANGAENIAITGSGTIDAQGHIEMARWGLTADTEDFKENAHGTHGETIEMPDVRRLRALGDVEGSERVFGKGTHLRPCAVEFYRCSRVLVEGITLRNSPFWCIHPVYCDNVTVRGVTIDSHSPNNDGCDPESSRNVLIENCLFRTGDDAVAIKGGKGTWADTDPDNGPCFNILIQHCKYGVVHSCLTLGSESVHDRNILLRNIEVNGADRVLWLKMRPDTPQHYEYVTADNITGATGSFLVVRPWTQFFQPGNRDDMPLSQCNHITISHINMECRNFFDVGTSDKYSLRNFTFRHINVKDEKKAFDPQVIENSMVDDVMVQ